MYIERSFCVRELAAGEIDEVNGALGPLAGVAIGVGVGLVANYLYDKAGGAEGIDNAIRNHTEYYGTITGPSAAFTTPI